VEALSKFDYMHAQSPASSKNGVTPYEKLWKEARTWLSATLRMQSIQTPAVANLTKFRIHANALLTLGFFFNRFIKPAFTLPRLWQRIFCPIPVRCPRDGDTCKLLCALQPSLSQERI